MSRLHVYCDCHHHMWTYKSTYDPYAFRKRGTFGVAAPRAVERALSSQAATAPFPLRL